MAPEIEQASGFFDWISKITSLAVAAIFGWAWRTTREQERMKEKQEALEERLVGIESGIGRILNYLTNTHLHEE